MILGFVSSTRVACAETPPSKMIAREEWEERGDNGFVSSLSLSKWNQGRVEARGQCGVTVARGA